MSGMPENFKRTKELPTPEAIEDEELFLLKRQAEHAEAMDGLGITEKAQAKLSEHDAAKLTNLSRPSLYLARKREEDGQVTDVLGVRFATPGISVSGPNSTGFVYAPVVEVTGDVISIEPEFTLPEVEAVIDMAAGLKEARDLGVLPNLSHNLASINNPLTAMTQVRPQEHSPQVK